MGIVTITKDLIQLNKRKSPKRSMVTVMGHNLQKTQTINLQRRMTTRLLR